MYDRNDLVAQGLARWHRGRLIPVMRGGSDEDEPNVFEGSPFADFAELPDLNTLDNDGLAGLITDLATALAEVTGNPLEFVTPTYTAAQHLAASRAADAKVKELQAALADRPEIRRRVTVDVDPVNVL